MIAALYVDLAGPYPGIPGVDCWDAVRDATRYAGPWPAVVHPPCGHWGRYHQKCRDDGHTGPIAVSQVRQFGGVLEHPKDSKLWRECGMPKPGEMPDAWGGFSILIYQRDWGHKADKATWLYIVGSDSLPPMPPSQPARGGSILEKMAKNKRHLTPPDFALWLVEVAKKCRRR